MQWRPLWSEAILNELEMCEADKLIGRGVEREDAVERARRLLAHMRAAFDDAVVVGWEPLERSYGLPDPDDEHVVAAAVAGGAGVIATENLKDFPSARVPSCIQVVTAKELATNTAIVKPVLAARALTSISERRFRPPQSPQELLRILVEGYAMDDLQKIVGPILDDARE